jgi:hypothetical protein
MIIGQLNRLRQEQTGALAPTYETEAQAYFDAIGTLTTLQKDAYNQFVVDTKATGIYSKISVLHPMTWGSAAANKWNAISPLDTDAAHRLTYFGTVTHSATGVKSNGTNGYANTFFNPITEASSTSSFGMGVYKTGLEGATYRMYMGVSGGGGDTYMGLLDREGASLAGANDWTPSTNIGEQTGFLYAAFNGNRNLQYYVNGVATGAVRIHNGVFTNLDIAYLCLNSNGTKQWFPSIAEFSCFIITTGMTPTEAANLNTALQTFITAL